MSSIRIWPALRIPCNHSTDLALDFLHSINFGFFNSHCPDSGIKSFPIVWWCSRQGIADIHLMSSLRSVPGHGIRVVFCSITWMSGEDTFMDRVAALEKWRERIFYLLSRESWRSDSCIAERTMGSSNCDKMVFNLCASSFRYWLSALVARQFVKLLTTRQMPFS